MSFLIPHSIAGRCAEALLQVKPGDPETEGRGRSVRVGISLFLSCSAYQRSSAMNSSSSSGGWRVRTMNSMRSVSSRTGTLNGSDDYLLEWISRS